MRYLYLLVLSLYLIFFSLHTQHTAWIEMLVYPYLLNHGFIFYQDLINSYTPILLWILQVLEGYFGYTPQFSQYLAIALSLLNLISIFWVTKMLWKKNSLSPYFAALYYCLWFYYFEGNGLWFELAQTSLIVWSFYFLHKYLIKSSTKKDLVIGGFFLALSFFIKQSTFWIYLGAILWLIISGKSNFRKIFLNISALVLPFVLLFVITSVAALFQGYAVEYWRWAFWFSFIVFPFSAGHKEYPTILQISKLALPILGVFICWLLSRRAAKKEIVFFIVFLLVTFMSALPRWGMFHLQPFLGVLSLVFGFLAYDLTVARDRIKLIVLSLLAVISIVVVGRQLMRFWGEPIRFFEPNIYQLSQDTQVSTGGDFITFNSYDQLYLTSGNVPKIKPYVQNFSWFMELPGMQNRVMNSIAKESPKYIIYSPVSGIGGLKAGDYNPTILSNFILSSYQLEKKLTNNVWLLKKI